MTSSPCGLYAQGYTRATMAATMGLRPREGEPIPKSRPSSDCRLQLACMKTESLVITYQLWGGEYVPGPCTHRPSRHGSRGHLKPRVEAG